MRKRWRLIALGILIVVAVVTGLLVGLSTNAASRPVHDCGSLVVPGLKSACPAGSSTTSTSTSTLAPTTSTTSLPPAVLVKRLNDGSLGYQAPRIACTLLSRTEISREFHAAVSPGVPVYPYCQWLIGPSLWLALEVEGQSFDKVTQWVVSYQTVHGLGDRAEVANDHVLYFSSGSTTYAISVQTPPNFDPAYDGGQLIALAHLVLAHALPSRKVAVKAQPPAGPPIYFAGDSTAAGPEWAWWQYHANTRATRTLSEYMVGSGLLRYNFWDWPRHLLAIAAERRPRLVIFMGSANDDQAVILRGRYARVGSPAWVAAYRKTVGSTMASLVREGCKVLWIGEPATQDPALSGAMRLLDSIYAEEARANPGVTFLNPGTVFNGKGGRYTGTVKIGGRETPVFLDGVHLNTAGSIYFADVIQKYVDRILSIKPA